jgi:hypothetical protein
MRRLEVILLFCFVCTGAMALDGSGGRCNIRMSSFLLFLLRSILVGMWKVRTALRIETDCCL